MIKYVDLVACRLYDDDFITVYQAPAWTYLEEGNDVLVEHPSIGTAKAKVVKVITIAEDNEAFDFILTLCDEQKPLPKVLSKVIYSRFKYEGENNGTDTDR